jgi:hypothetical protein
MPNCVARGAANVACGSRLLQRNALQLYHGHQTVWYAIDRLDWRF